MHWSSVFNDIFLSCILLPSEIYKKFIFWYKNLKVIGKSKKLVLWLNIQIMQKAYVHIKGPFGLNLLLLKLKTETENIVAK